MRLNSVRQLSVLCDPGPMTVLNLRAQPGASTSGRQLHYDIVHKLAGPIRLIASRQHCPQRPAFTTAAVRKTITLPPSVGVDNGFYRILRKGDVEPDFNDPDWADKVRAVRESWSAALTASMAVRFWELTAYKHALQAYQ